MKKILSNIGPGTLVAAAFIGPGTLTVCTIAGVEYGFTLLWAMVLSIVATLVLQEMAMRLGMVHGKGLAETVKEQIASPLIKGIVVLLILSAIVIGNAAYEAGNISGGAMGLEIFLLDNNNIFKNLNISLLSVVIGSVAFMLLFIGNYKVIERALIALVILMSVSFVVTAFLTQPDIGNIFRGLFVPVIPDEGLLTIIAVVGTTVVPYNLFLHPALVREKWQDMSDIKYARYDTFISILLGGIVSLAIIICAAAIQGGKVTNAADVAEGLQPLFGNFAGYFLGAGLFAAGITSAVTAPLAAAYVAGECFGWEKKLKSVKFRAIWMGILIMGVIISTTGYKPVDIIKFAQVTNGLLLPVVGGILLWVVNKCSVMGNYQNSIFQNILGVVIICTTVILCLRSMEKVFDLNIF